MRTWADDVHLMVRWDFVSQAMRSRKLCGVILIISLAALCLRAGSSRRVVGVPGNHVSGVSGNLFTGEKVRSFRGARRQNSSQRSHSAFVHDNLSHCENWAVCTTIFEPSEAVHDVCKRFSTFCLVVVADLKTKEPFQVLGNCEFIYLSVSRQRELSSSSKFALHTPWNHFGRKNLGYLFAVANGAKQIWDFDDDNLLLSSENMGVQNGKEPESYVGIRELNSTFMNPYPLLGAEQFSWPRGFPLELILSASTRPSREHVTKVPARAEQIGVVQALANNDPDVDAIYRLQRPLPFSFRGLSKNHALFLIPSKTFVPWNAQATLFRHRDAMWTAYLPISVHGRVSDIWRSLIAQRLFRDACLRTAFMTEATVQQNRNPHSYLADFDAEQDLYRKSRQLIEFLDRWQPSQLDFPDQIEQLYVELYERDYVGLRDIEMIQLWLAELRLINYRFPTFQGDEC